MSRKSFSMWVLPNLWSSVKEHCSLNDTSISQAHEEFCLFLLSTEWNIPFQINRQVSSYILRRNFAQEFPVERKMIMLNMEIMSKLTDQIKLKLMSHYGTDLNVTMSAIVTMDLFLYSKQIGLEVSDDNYFKDDYFTNNYVLSEVSMFDKVNSLYRKLGRLPTAREYAAEGGYSSLSYLKSHFGSYSNAMQCYLKIREP